MPDPPPAKTAGGTESSSAAGLPHGERRTVPRYPFIADAVVTELNTGARLSARTSEVGLKGCYIDTLNPFPGGTLVQVRLVCDKGAFETPGRVVYTQAGYGMGVAFTDVPPNQLAILESWVGELKKQS